MRYTLDVSKSDLLFDLLHHGGVIRLTEGHVIPNANILAKKTYCVSGTILVLIPLTNAIFSAIGTIGNQQRLIDYW
jgi:hypothetical protein